jgi:hypothetical protein
MADAKKYASFSEYIRQKKRWLSEQLFIMDFHCYPTDSACQEAREMASRGLTVSQKGDCCVYVYVPRKKIGTPSNSWLTTNQDLKTPIKPTT